MAFAMILPNASESVVTVLLRQRYIFDQQRCHLRDKRIYVTAMLPLLFALEVTSEGGSPLNPPH
jgi:hypothetical protein